MLILHEARQAVQMVSSRMKPHSKDSTTKVYIGNLPPRCTERDIEDLCKQFGSVERADIVKNFAFVVGLA